MQSRPPVAKPGANASRQVQLDQLQKRFSASFKTIQSTDKGTTVRLALPPSDPDFPFDLESLLVQLEVPAAYPRQQCTLTVLNSDIPKGFALNVERGYAEYVGSVETTLVRQFGWLDRQLETLLQQQPSAVQVVPAPKVMAPPLPEHVIQAVKAASEASKKPELPSGVASAFGRRSREVDQLKTRFGKDVRASKSDRTLLHLTITLNDPQFKRTDVFPDRIVRLRYHIPLQYPLSPCSIDLDSRVVDKQLATHIATQFDLHVAAAPDASLFEHINWVNRHMQAILDAPVQGPTSTDAVVTPLLHLVRPTQAMASSSLGSNIKTTSSPRPVVRKSLFADEVDTKNRLIIVHDNSQQQAAAAAVSSSSSNNAVVASMSSSSSSSDEDEDSNGDSGSSSDNGSEEEEDDQPTSSTMASSTNSGSIRRGTEIRLVDPELDNVTLLRCVVLHLLVKCNRCKNTVDVENIQPSAEADGDSKTRWLPCTTCQAVIGVKFLPAMVHAHASSMGFLQLAGCVAFDLLPSNFIGACAACLQDMDHGLRLAPHERPLTQACRHCHAKFSILFKDYRFVRLGAGGERLQADDQVVMKLKKKKKPQDMILMVGQPLPNQGTCKHYGKSKRWFRFPCCSKLYACDVCHDKQEDHVAETAHRQVCGMCSKEQTIVGGRPCLHCAHEFDRSLGKGAFWEGGQGVRSKQLMSRNDSHKHKGLSKTGSKKQDRVGLSGKQNRDKQQNQQTSSHD
ncbi:hypothetical protein BC940DRAFT_311371 [Gongronella butleri]|nr:hypothetical protein BC940DRAFT_311371 [Gongronella butleri]